MKLTKQQLLQYVAHDVKIKWIDEDDYYGIAFNCKSDYSKKLFPLSTLLFTIDQYDDLGWRLILHPLSDLTKEIEHNGEKFVPIRWFEKEGWFGNDLLRGMVKNNYINIETLPHCIVKKLIEWHFDVFGLIPAGLAIPKDSI